MNNANFMRLGKSVGNLCRDGDGFAKWNRAGAEQFADRLAIHQFHGDIVRAVHLPEFVNRDDVWVIKRARGTSFLLEAS